MLHSRTGNPITAIRLATLVAALALATVAGPTAADRAPEQPTLPVVTAALATVPGMVIARTWDSGRLAFLPAGSPPGPQVAGVRFARGGDTPASHEGWLVAAARHFPLASNLTPPPEVGGFMSAGMATRSGGATHLGDAFPLARDRRPAGTTASSAAADTGQSPFPEPGTWAMFVAGVLGAGAIARRRASL